MNIFGNEDEEPQTEEYVEEEEMIDEIAQEAIEETNQMDLDEDDRIVEEEAIEEETEEV